jgi:glycine cleavage system regulatory protein
MHTQFTITIAGQDHPQLVNQLAAATHNLGGKWIVSKITRLAQQVVGIIKIDIPTTAVEQLKQEFNAQKGLQIRIIDENESNVASARQQLKLKIESGDRLGIIKDITRTLEDIDIKITQIENHRVAVPEFGGLMFFAELALDIPTEINIEQLVDNVQQLEANMRVDVIS